MNINSILDRINTVIRGRFSSNNGAAWVNWTSDILDMIERECPGVGQHASVMAYPMDSGFVPRPSCLSDITSLRIGGKNVDFSKMDLGVWPELLPDTDPITRSSMTGMASSSNGMEISFIVDGDEQSLIDAGVRCLEMDVQIISVNSGTGTLVTGIGGASLDGYRIKVNGEFIPIENSAYDSVLNVYTFDLAFTTDDITTPFRTSVVGFDGSFFDGWSLNIGNIQATAYKATWVKPTYGNAWSTTMEFKCSLLMPCKPFSYKTATLIKTNVELSGYTTFSRPTSLTDEFSMDNKYISLMAAGLEMKAELMMDSSSSDARNRSAIFEQLLMNYRIDQSQSRGKAAVRATNSNPRLGRKNRGW